MKKPWATEQKSRRAVNRWAEMAMEAKVYRVVQAGSGRSRGSRLNSREWSRRKGR